MRKYERRRWTDSVNSVAVRGPHAQSVRTRKLKKKAIIDSRDKISLDEKSLQSQAKSCDSILNPAKRARNYAD